ncbi:helix-turn-helix domain-containing protein [Halobellus rufus]|uniref:helix-turn-helix domain-containing protein n=1 Tax=Halobellus rufus TaxID=1448860 RepID=UPI00067846FA|nr:helix-turn-helix domain-containing protein [Halobellus rufus]
MKRVQFSARYPDEFVHPLHQQIIDHGPITRAELLMWSPTADATTLFWCDGCADATATAIDAIESLVVRTLVAETDGTYAFLRQNAFEFAPVLLDAIADARVIFLPPVVFRDTGAVRFEAVGEASELSSFHGELSDHIGLTIERVHEFERRDSPSRLTDRQRDALETAVAVGYYEIPRDGTVTDVAARLGCSTSTAGELIRKAEAAVIREYAESR